MSDRKTEIVTAARDLFLRGGVEGMSMRAVAAQVGVSATALYRHFRDKDDLLRAVVDEGRETFERSLAGALRGTTPRERLRLTGLRYLAFAFEQPEYYQVFFLSWHRLDVARHGRPGGPTQVGGAQSLAQRFLFERLQECAQAGLLAPGEDPMALALFLWGEVHGLAALWVASAVRNVLPEPAFRQYAQGCVDRAVAAVLISET